MNIFKVSIVGKPNVGKSSLFNRILKKRISIIYENPGTTKDRLYDNAFWLNKKFLLIDTGGIVFENIPLKQKIKEQTEFAIKESNLIIFVTDGQNLVTEEDLKVSKILHKSKKKVIVAVNKIDNKSLLGNIYDFYCLGFKNIIGISVKHGIGIGELLDKIIFFRKMFINNTEITDKNEKNIKFCLIGKPNVGKSTFKNTFLSKKRMIVENIPGTTTDVISTFFERKGKKYYIIDTPGLIKKSRISEKQEKYSFLRTIECIEKSDIVCFIIDISQKITEQDRNISSLIFNYNKACLIICNKWDLIKNQKKNVKFMEQYIKKEFPFLNHVPVIFLSAKDNKRMHLFLPIIEKVFKNYETFFSNKILNDILYESTQINPPSFYKNGKAKFFFLKQVDNKPPEFLCLVNNPKLIHFSYERFLKNQLRKNLELDGINFKITFRKKEEE
ncbi:MAG: ribosome biogenesis GTP-binding protein [Candidatus Phytoplasma cynodontis]|uniref:ribosome biogenesis GTPase Der n=1 Tax='Cynodon dactylon' phytoplasma TaxID=295320 RepID=UPI001265CFAF|nr:ribosome biogenesis GTPase Der ['Cynodon dactylon' phytoplasma]KAB8122063.1 ribosome biogenesis GTPase Der ['Cynodon dactylon' phytoplasma]WIA07521.1 MAG: ribosome biogenesis GTP-binding protein [Candidatus Phytoplasma cynodontis]